MDRYSDTAKKKVCEKIEYINEQSIYSKYPDISEHSYCFCCMYDSESSNDCKCCPIDWGNGRYCHNSGVLYTAWTWYFRFKKLDKEAIKKVAYSAYKISKLPERKKEVKRIPARVIVDEIKQLYGML